MTFEEFSSRIEDLLAVGITIPHYYLEIDDESEWSPKELADYFNRDVGRVREWFNTGLKHGKLPSIEPTRHKCTGKMLKEWWFKRDLPRFMRDPTFRNLL